MTQPQAREALAKVNPRNARYEPMGQLIWAETDKGTMRLCDLRGWGHLTGHGQAWGLDAATAKLVQDEIGEQLAEAWNTRTESEKVKQLVEAAEKVNMLRHADNATGNSFVPDRTDKAIDGLEKALAQYQGGK